MMIALQWLQEHQVGYMFYGIVSYCAAAAATTMQ